MTATEELRALLDERGVEYVANHRQTWWRFGTEGHAFAVNDGSTLCVALTEATAAQAIEATLGRGECRVEWMGTDDEGGFQCLACGAELGYEAGEFHYCPYCGREVAE